MPLFVLVFIIVHMSIRSYVYYSTFAFSCQYLIHFFLARNLLGVGKLLKSARFNTPRLRRKSSEYAYGQIISLCLLRPRLAACSE